MEAATSENDIVQKTSWPASVTLPQEEVFFTICLGCFHPEKLHWGLHKRRTNKFYLDYCWSTKSLPEEIKNPTALLCRLLPERVKEIIFCHGKATKEVAAATSRKRKIPQLTIYVVSLNDDPVNALAWCFSEIPCRIFQVKETDFFTKEQGLSKVIGMGSLMTLRAMTKHPCLVFSCLEENLTYIASDTQGNILGTGIVGEGIMASCQKQVSGSELDDEGPPLSENAVKEVIKNKKDVDTFSSGQSAIVYQQLDRIILRVRHAIKGFMERVGHSCSENGGNQTTRISKMVRGVRIERIQKPDDSPAIVFIGPEASLLEQLLYPLDLQDADIPSHQPMVVQKIGNALNAMSLVLNEKLLERQEDPVMKDLNLNLLGRRIAKKFQLVDADGDSVYRGTLCAIINKNKNYPTFRINYDDGERETMSLVDLHEALVLFSKTGEKHKDLPRLEFDKLSIEKQKSSKAAATYLESSYEAAKKIAVQRRKEENDSHKVQENEKKLA